MAKVTIQVTLNLRLFLWLKIHASVCHQSVGQMMAELALREIGRAGYPTHRQPNLKELEDYGESIEKGRDEKGREASGEAG